MSDLTEQAKSCFSGDKFAMLTGIVIEYAEENFARCYFDAQPMHYNANSVIMGGALFTLADFAYTVAANTKTIADGLTPAVTVASGIRFLHAAKGGRITAEARCLRSGRTVCMYSIRLTDADGTLIADADVTGIRPHN